MERGTEGQEACRMDGRTDRRKGERTIGRKKEKTGSKLRMEDRKGRKEVKAGREGRKGRKDGGRKDGGRKEKRSIHTHTHTCRQN